MLNSLNCWARKRGEKKGEDETKEKDGKYSAENEAAAEKGVSSKWPQYTSLIYSKWPQRPLILDSAGAPFPSIILAVADNMEMASALAGDIFKGELNQLTNLKEAPKGVLEVLSVVLVVAHKKEWPKQAGGEMMDLSTASEAPSGEVGGQQILTWDEAKEMVVDSGFIEKLKAFEPSLMREEDVSRIEQLIDARAAAHQAKQATSSRRNSLLGEMGGGSQGPSRKNSLTSLDESAAGGGGQVPKRKSSLTHLLGLASPDSQETELPLTSPEYDASDPQVLNSPARPLRRKSSFTELLFRSPEKQELPLTALTTPGDAGAAEPPKSLPRRMSFTELLFSSPEKARELPGAATEEAHAKEGLALEAELEAGTLVSQHKATLGGGSSLRRKSSVSKGRQNVAVTVRTRYQLLSFPSRKESRHVSKSARVPPTHEMTSK